MWPIRATATAGIARGMPYRVLAAPRRLRSRLHGSCALLPAPCDDQQCAADNRQQEQATWHPRAMERGKEEDRHHEQRQTRHGDSHTRHHTPRSTRARLGHASPARGTRAPLMPIGRHASSPPLADRHRGIKGRPVPSGEEISHRAAKPRTTSSPSRTWPAPGIADCLLLSDDHRSGQAILCCNKCTILLDVIAGLNATE